MVLSHCINGLVRLNLGGYGPPNYQIGFAYTWGVPYPPPYVWCRQGTWMVEANYTARQRLV